MREVKILKLGEDLGQHPKTRDAAMSKLARPAVQLGFNDAGGGKHWLGHFVYIGLVGPAAGGGAAGEIAKVTQVFQPEGRFSAANSL